MASAPATATATATATINMAKIYRPIKYKGDLPGVKNASRTKNGSRTSKDVVPAPLSEYPATREEYPINDVLDESLLAMRRLYQTEGYANWTRTEYDTAAKKNKIMSKLPKFMMGNVFNVSNSSRITALTSSDNRQSRALKLVFKGNFMGRTTFTLELVEELRKILVYFIASGSRNIDADIDKMIWTLTHIDTMDVDTIKYLETKTLEKDRYVLER